MKTDVQLKVLARECAADLLELTGDVGATVQSAEVVEIPALQRRVDCVIKLVRDREVYYRHLEFQAEPAPDLAERCFRYNTQLVLLYGAPVLITAVLLQPPAPEGELVYRVLLAGREVNRWSFETIRLWDLDARRIVERSPPGVLALVPMMRGQDLDVVARAGERILEAFPGVEMPAALDVLLALAGQLYSVEQLSRAVGREKVMRNSIWEAAMAEGEAKGLAEGQAKGMVEDRRALCLELARKHHPALLAEARTVIEACNDLERLKGWILGASDADDAGFARMLGLGPS